MKFTKTTIPLLIGIPVAIAAVLVGRGAGGRQVELSFAVPVQKDAVIELVENGMLEAESATHIAAPNVNSERKLIDIVPEGMIVKKGDILAKFDTARLEEILEAFEHSGLKARRKDIEMESEIKIADLKAANQTAVENAKLAELTFKTMAYAAKLDRDAAEARLNNARNEIKVAANRVKQEENRRDVQLRQQDDLIAENDRKVAETKQAIEDFTVHAPEDGIVVYPLIKISGLTRKAQTGDLLYKSQIFLIIPNLFKMTAQLEIAEEDIRRVKMGQEAALVLEAFKDARFTGEVYSIAPLAHVKENNEFIKVFTVGVRVRERDLDRLRPGMNARVTLRLAEYKNAWTIPVQAVVDAGREGFSVHVEKDGTIRSVPVDVTDSGRDVAVISAPVKGKVVIPDSGLRDYLADPARSSLKIKWKEAGGG
jgi:multidrug efflux pump subunit AcrA (membrane-fusion protein)